MRDYVESERPDDRTIRRPALSAVLDPFTHLLKLPPRSPSGFIPSRENTFVETVIDSQGDGVGPLSVSTACNHLFCYTVRYEQRKLGVMIVAGQCVQEALTDGRVRRDLEILHSAALYHGPVVFHSLTTVVTPKSARGLLPSTILHRGQTELHQTIARVSDDSLAPPPPLALLRVKLDGWLPFERTVPTCIFESWASGFMMHVAWGKRPANAEHIRLA